MAVISLATIAEIFKILNPDGIESLVLPASPTLGLVSKWNQFYGESKRLDWMIDAGGGAHSTFSVAQAQAGVPIHKRPNVTRSRLYAVRQIERETLLASKKDQGALVAALKHAVETATDELKKRSGSLLLGDGTGQIGQISATSTVGNATITLADPQMVINFRVGGVYNTFTAGDAAVNAGDVTLTAINEDTGELTVATNWGAQSAGVAASDYIVPKGDYNNVPKGMFAWNPITLPAVGGGDNFFGVDRGGSAAMCGQRMTGGGTIDEVLTEALAKHRGDHDSILLNPIDWGSLSKQSTNWQRINKNAIGANGKPIASIGYQALVMNGPKGAVNVYSEPYMRQGYSKLTKMSDWEMWSLESPFDLIREGMGNEGAMPLANADGIELRFGGYWNFVTKNPRNTMHVTL